MIISIKSHGTYYPVDASSLWYSPSAHRWHGCILGDYKPFTMQTHGGPVDMNTFAAIRDEFILEDIDAGDICPFCGNEMGKHRLDVTCPCPPKVCEHKETFLEVEGSRHFNGGEIVDTLIERVICMDCGKELDSE